jgi:LacI family transcriptional regulator
MKYSNVLVQIGLFDQRQLLGISRFAKDHRWHLTVDDRFDLPYGWDGDGAIVLLHGRKELIPFVRRLDVPVVDLGIYYPNMRIPRVIGDHEAIGKLAAVHFTERHYTDIAWFSTIWTHVHGLRFKGLRDHWRGNPPLRWVWSENAPPSKRNARLTLERWLKVILAAAPKPLAVLAFDDYDAARIQDACIAAGIKVPSEVAILGIDNNELIDENRSVPLASVRHDLEGIGYRAAELLHRLMNGGRPPPAPILIPPKGIALRQSADYIAVHDPLVRDALAYIRENIGRSFGTDEIASSLGLSRTSLDRKAKACLGHALGAEILAQRIVQAKLLLANSALKVRQIARETGFCDISHLSKSFVKLTGETPLRYRRQHQKTPGA